MGHVWDTKKTQKKKKKKRKSPHKSGRRALRARLPDSHRVEKGSILRDSLLTELGLAPYAPLTVQNQYVFKKQGPLQWWVLSKKVTFFAALVKLHFLAAKCKGIPEDTVNSIFLRSKKII